MSNPFKIKWLKGWRFQLVFLGSNVRLEAHGFGTCLITSISPGESPSRVADQLVCSENKRRKSIYNSWKNQMSIGVKTPLALSNISKLNLAQSKVNPYFS